MLNSFRSLANSVWAKILVAFLVLSFAIWGIGDMVRNPARKQAVATVGNETITSDAFMRSLRQETDNLRRVLGDNYSPELVKNMNLAPYVLHKEINQLLLKQESEALGLIPGDADVVRHIRGIPGFQDEKGNFDKTIFEATLKHANISEKAYVEEIRQEMAINLLADTLTGVMPVSDTAARMLLEAREEQRSVTIYSLSPSLVTDVGQPNESQIKAYYDSHNRDFTAPEYRTLSYVTISSADVPANTALSEDALKAAYKERLDEFKRPERRQVEQLLYSSEDKARAAMDMIKSGKSFEQVGKSTDIMNKNALSLGKVEHGNILEKAADAVFSLKAGETTQPIESPFGWHIFYVSTIEPPSVAPFEEVRPALEKDMKQRNADDGLSKLANTLEDALAGGSTLQEAAKTLGLKVIAVGPVDRAGHTPEGNKAKDLPDFPTFLTTAFKTEEKTESPMATAKGGIFYLVRVDSILSERLRSLDEVRGIVVSNWQNEERGKHLSTLAQTIGASFATPTGRSAAIAKYRLQPAAVAAIKHTSTNAKELALPAPLVSEAFSHAPQQATSAYPAQSGNYLIAVIDSIIPAPPPEKNAKGANSLAEIRKDLERDMQNEILEQYVHSLTNTYPVSVNDAVLHSLIASSRQP